jgi:hypothetical protein
MLLLDPTNAGYLCGEILALSQAAHMLALFPVWPPWDPTPLTLRSMGFHSLTRPLHGTAASTLTLTLTLTPTLTLTLP